MTKKGNNILINIWKFYIQGFQNMSNWGRKVWLIILIKLFIMFVILKLFFFPNFLQKNFKTDQERSQHVLEVLTEPK